MQRSFLAFGGLLELQRRSDWIRGIIIVREFCIGVGVEDIVVDGVAKLGGDGEEGGDGLGRHCRVYRIQVGMLGTRYIQRQHCSIEPRSGS